MITEKEYLEAKRIIKEYENKQLNISAISLKSEQLCQWHDWVKYHSHPKIGAMICKKCRTVLA